jgi:hypothetical protein
LTPVTNSLTDTLPLLFPSNAAQFVTGFTLSAMLTPLTNSLIFTWPLPSQSPTHCAPARSAPAQQRMAARRAEAPMRNGRSYIVTSWIPP